MSPSRRAAFLVDAVRVAPVSLDWWAGVRLALAIVGPLVLGEILDLGPGATLAALVAINVGLADEPAAYGVRFRLMATAAILFCGAVALATVAEPSGAAVLVASVGLAMVAAIAAGLGARGAKLGLLTAIVWTIFAYGDLPDPHVGIRVAASAAGAGWVLVLYLWPWPFRATRPVARSVDSVWTALSALVRRPADAVAVRAVRARLDVAAETLRHSASAPAVLAGQIRAADVLTTAVSGIGRSGAYGAPTDAWLRAVGDLRRDDRSDVLAGATETLERSGGDPSVVALGRAAQRRLDEPEPFDPGSGWSLADVRLADAARRLRSPGARQWHHAVRYAVAVAVAGALALWTPLQHSYWVPLTVLIVLAPTANATLAKGVQRTVGTLVGVTVGVVVAGVAPAGPVSHYVVLGVLAGLIGVLMPVNYGVAVIFITSTVVILLSWPATNVGSVATARLVDTLVGAAIGLAVGVLVWPRHPRDDLGPSVAGALRATARYADAAIRPLPGAVDVPRTRRTATSAVNTASAIVAEAAADWSRPPPTADARLLEAVHATIRAVFDVRLHIRGATLALDGATDSARQAVVDLLDRLADATSERRMPDVAPPDPAAWPDGLRDLGAACRSTYDLVLATVAGTQR